MMTLFANEMNGTCQSSRSSAHPRSVVTPKSTTDSDRKHGSTPRAHSERSTEPRGRKATLPTHSATVPSITTTGVDAGPLMSAASGPHTAGSSGTSCVEVAGWCGAASTAAPAACTPPHGERCAAPEGPTAGAVGGSDSGASELRLTSPDCALSSGWVVGSVPPTFPLGSVPPRCPSNASAPALTSPALRAAPRPPPPPRRRADGRRPLQPARCTPRRSLSRRRRRPCPRRCRGAANRARADNEGKVGGGPWWRDEGRRWREHAEVCVAPSRLRLMSSAAQRVEVVMWRHRGDKADGRRRRNKKRWMDELNKPVAKLRRTLIESVNHVDSKASKHFGREGFTRSPSRDVNCNKVRK